MQTHRQTWLEVGIDLALSLMVDIEAQLLVCGALATAGRSLMFAALLLGFARTAHTPLSTTVYMQDQAHL